MDIKRMTGRWLLRMVPAVALVAALPAQAYLIGTECFGGGGSGRSSTSSALPSVECTSVGVRTATGTSSVDLGSQSLRAFATAPLNYFSYGSAYLSETITILGATGGLTQVDLTLLLTGGFYGAGFTSQAALGSLAIASGPTARADYRYSGSGYALDSATYSVASNGTYTVTDLSTGPDDIRTALTVSFELDLAAPSFDVVANLVAWAFGDSGYSESIFDNTATLSIRLAQGLSAVTDSGASVPFTPVSSVPEPGTLALVLSALVAPIGVRRAKCMERRSAWARRSTRSGLDRTSIRRDPMHGKEGP
jgi:hypothetical protein